MNCEQVREMEAAFALDVLEGADRIAVLEHLRSCDLHPGAGEYRAVSIALAAQGAELTPPARLRERVLASARERTAVGQGGRRRWYAAAALLIAACVAGGALLISTMDGETDSPYVHEFTSDGGISVRLEADFDEGLAQVAFRGLTAGEEYHLWSIRGEDWLSMGRFTANPEGSWSGEFSFAIQRGDALCLTNPAPELPAGPFGEPLFIEQL